MKVGGVELGWNHRLARRWPLPVWVGGIWAALIALLAFATAVLQALDRNVTSSSWAWVHGARLQLAVGLSLAFVVFIDSTRRAFVRFRSASESKLRRNIRNQLGAAVAATCAVADPAPKPGDLGCGLFLIQHRWIGPDRLVRVERMRLLDKIPESGLNFAKGAGTVGKCWETNTLAYHRWSRVNKRYATNPPSEEAWAKLRDDTKHGLDYDAWRTLVGRYAEVLAIPVTRNGKTVGCVALDITWDEEDPDPPPVLKQREVRESLGGIARVLGAELGDNS